MMYMDRVKFTAFIDCHERTVGYRIDYYHSSFLNIFMHVNQAYFFPISNELGVGKYCLVLDF